MTQLVLVPPELFEPIDPSTQLDRFPPKNAPCICDRDDCRGRFPFCSWKTVGREDE